LSYRRLERLRLLVLVCRHLNRVAVWVGPSRRQDSLGSAAAARRRCVGGHGSGSGDFGLLQRLVEHAPLEVRLPHRAAVICEQPAPSTGRRPAVGVLRRGGASRPLRHRGPRAAVQRIGRARADRRGRRGLRLQGKWKARGGQ